jgi:aspartate kinase
MKVFKFGGASVKDADGVKNIAKILTNYINEDIVVVISAMGKMTNALENVVNAFYNEKQNLPAKIAIVKEYHQTIINELFPEGNKILADDLHNLYVAMEWELEGDDSIYSYDQQYDQVVSIGELISTRIVSAYLASAGIANHFLDVRDCIKTDDTYREGKIDWALTEKLVTQKVSEILTNGTKLIITQGFIGGTSENYTCTLGREGSDYSASIFAYCLNAQDVTIWKDVPGVMNADPKILQNAVVLPQLSYHDAIELTYYGATVIHPKTLKPLQNKHIPLYVKSFVDIKQPGTVINEERAVSPTPCLIFKPEQLLISISPKDFSFIVEENLSSIFNLFSVNRVKINMMQNSALSLTISVDDNNRQIPELIEELKQNFKVLYNKGATLITIRNYNEEAIKQATAGKQILVEQRSRNTVQLVVK